MRLMNPAYAPQQMNINDKPPQMPASFQPTAPVLTDQRQTAGLPVPVPSNQTASTGQGFFDFLGGLGDLFANNASTLAGIGSIAGALDNASDIRDLGYGVQEHLQNMGNNLNTGSQFQGYGVTSGTGENAITSNVGADGGIDLGVGPDTQMQTNAANNMTGSQNAFNHAMGQNWMVRRLSRPLLNPWRTQARGRQRYLTSLWLSRILLLIDSRHSNRLMSTPQGEVVSGAVPMAVRQKMRRWLRLGWMGLIKRP